MQEGFLKEVNNLPHQPGVYLIKDKNGDIIYIGKAKDLHKRVNTYFQRPPSSKTRALLKNIDKVDYLVTTSEKEALILECNLIKTYCPRYNVVLRDDKNYPYLRLDLKQKWPRIIIVRRMKRDGAAYFGPFTSSKAVRETLKAMDRLFPLRKCSDHEFKNRIRPCLNYQIGRCLAPCVGYVNEEGYLRLAKQASLFLKGKRKEILEDLEREMKRAADALEFEQAAFYRDRIKAVKYTLERQSMVSSDFVDRDVFGHFLTPSKKRLQVVILLIRHGLLIGELEYILSLRRSDKEEAFSQSFKQFYFKQDMIPKEVIIPFHLEEKGVLEEWLSEKAGYKVNILCPKRGNRLRLLKMAIDNARLRVETRLKESNVLEALKKELFLSKIPKRIECFDVSNIKGQYAVASMVVFTNGLSDKDEYRRFRLEYSGHPDDYGMMEEVLKRRFSYTDVLPDLVMIDGGKGQLAIAEKTLAKQGLKDIEVIAIAKGKEGEEDKIYLKNYKQPLALNGHAKTLILLKHIRDEAHRFAITYYKRLHRKAVVSSILDNIPGLGPKRKAVLWKHFHSLEEIKKADVKALKDIGLPQDVAKRLKQKLAFSNPWIKMAEG